MKLLRPLKDKSLNDLIVGFIIAFSTVATIQSIFQMLSFSLFQPTGASADFGAPPIPWREVLVQLAGYLLCLLTAAAVHRFGTVNRTK